MAATNAPERIDGAMRRRLQEQVYVSLPCQAASLQMLHQAFGRPNLTFAALCMYVDQHGETAAYAGMLVHSQMTAHQCCTLLCFQSVHCLHDCIFESPVRAFQHAINPYSLCGMFTVRSLRVLAFECCCMQAH